LTVKGQANNVLKIIDKDLLKETIDISLSFYYNNLFNSNGSSRWKMKSSWPIDIHDLAQGIITFSKAARIDIKYKENANKITNWVIENMRDSNGFFYYQKWPLFNNKINYMRWSQAWMSLALSEYLKHNRT